MEEDENLEEFTLASIREAIHNLHESFPPETRTPEIKKCLEELYKIEAKLHSEKNGSEKNENN